MTDWATTESIPDLTGKRALVTGVTGGLGEATVLELVRHGCEVLMAARGRGKLDGVVGEVRAEVPSATVHPVLVDLADQSSVRRAAFEVASYGPLDILVNNAGVMATPYRRTVDGFELQMGTNHFGHFALTGLLWPQLVAADAARVVSLGSQSHRVVRRPPLEDPRYSHRRYRRWLAYAESKLATLMFTFELDRRARAAGLPVRALAAHPGWTSTALMGNGRTLDGRTVRGGILTAAFAVAGQKPDTGCLPTLMAATADLPGGTYVGPDGFLELRGMPEVVKASRLARDPEACRRLWEISEHVTSIRYP